MTHFVYLIKDSALCHVNLGATSSHCVIYRIYERTPRHISLVMVMVEHRVC